jgi:hypothetical protein
MRQRQQTFPGQGKAQRLAFTFKQGLLIVSLQLLQLMRQRRLGEKRSAASDTLPVSCKAIRVRKWRSSSMVGSGLIMKIFNAKYKNYAFESYIKFHHAGATDNKEPRMTTLHLAGFPRIGAKRELKFLQENYWQGQIDEQALKQGARELRQRHWLLQKGAGITLSPLGDFSLYDHVLDAQILVGAIPPRFGFDAANLSLEQYFQLARGNQQQPALEMTKWFDTNYHYLVPEWHADTRFAPTRPPAGTTGRSALGIRTKPVLIGPLTLAVAGQMQRRRF